jgi:hypothetical protein
MTNYRLVILAAATALVAASALILSTSPAHAACDIYDRACWEAKRTGVMGGNGQPALYENNRSCQDMLMDLHNTSQDALAHLYARHQTFSPTGRGVDYDNPTGGVGYIDHASVHEIEREIVMIVNVAIRDVRMVRYDGANVGDCRSITEQAIRDVNSIKNSLP